MCHIWWNNSRLQGPKIVHQHNYNVQQSTMDGTCQHILVKQNVTVNALKNKNLSQRHKSIPKVLYHTITCRHQLYVKDTTYVGITNTLKVSKCTKVIRLTQGHAQLRAAASVGWADGLLLTGQCVCSSSTRYHCEVCVSIASCSKYIEHPIHSANALRDGPKHGPKKPQILRGPTERCTGLIRIYISLWYRHFETGFFLISLNPFSPRRHTSTRHRATSTLQSLQCHWTQIPASEICVT